LGQRNPPTRHFFFFFFFFPLQPNEQYVVRWIRKKKGRGEGKIPSKKVFPTSNDMRTLPCIRIIMPTNRIAHIHPLRGGKRGERERPFDSHICHTQVHFWVNQGRIIQKMTSIYELLDSTWRR
jgi:hypothetical protein